MLRNRIPDNPIQINGLISIGTDYGSFYWWDANTDTITENYADETRDWAPGNITEDDLPEHCRETLRTARQMIAEGKEIPVFESHWR